MLFTLLAERYERRSLLLITSNLVFSDWDRIFKNPLTTAAAIDRLVHHAIMPSSSSSPSRASASRTRRGAAARRVTGDERPAPDGPEPEATV